MTDIKNKIASAAGAGKSIVPVLLFICFLFIFAGCTRVNVTHEVNPKVDFSSMKTYAWTPMKTEGSVNERNTEDLEKAVQSDLTLKGFTLTTASPDFVVSARISIEKVVAIPPDVILPNGRGTVETHNEGTIVLDFLDSQSNELLYRCSGVLAIDSQKWTSGQREETIRKSVQQLLKNFPPDAGK